MTRARRGTALALVVVATTAAAAAPTTALVLLCLPLLHRVTGAAGQVGRAGATGHPDLASLLAAGCAALVLACWARLLLGVVLCTADAARRRPAPTSRLGCALRPAAGRVLARRLLAVTAAGLVTGAVAGPAAQAAQPTQPAAQPAAQPASTLPLPVRPDAVPAAQPAAPRPTVVVRPGDTLWDLAAEHLVTATAGDRAARTDRAWRALHALNRDRIGPDPDLIQPGTRLRLPANGGTS